MSFFLLQMSPKQDHRGCPFPSGQRAGKFTSKTFHLSRKLGSPLSSQNPFLLCHIPYPKDIIMLFAHPGALSPLIFLHVYFSSLPPSSASPSLYLRVLSQHPIISLWKQRSHFNLFVQYLVLHQAPRFMVLFVLSTVATPVFSRGSGTCLALKYMKETKHEAVRFYLHKKYV